jgi:WD repeat-containing protein 68
MCRLINENQPEFASPMTSFDWNPKDPNIICCSSIDTTCSLWDIHEQKLQKLVITHDKEVFDISFGPDGNNFVTVGCDFTARLFDIRDLTESSIICEYNEPVIRIAWNSSVSTHLLAVTTLTSKEIYLHDIRQPIVPINKLSFHEEPINDLVWSPDSPFLLCSIS